MCRQNVNWFYRNRFRENTFSPLFQNLYSPKLFINTDMSLSLACINVISTQRVRQQDAIKYKYNTVLFTLLYLVQQIKFTSATTQGQSCGPFGNHPTHTTKQCRTEGRTEGGCLNGKLYFIVPDRSNAWKVLNERCCRAEYAYPALVRVSRGEWSPLLSRQLCASRGVYSLTLGMCEVLLQGLAGTAAWVKMHNAFPCLPVSLREAQGRHWLLLTQHILSHSSGQRQWRALAVLDNHMREERSGSSAPATERFTVGLQGTPTGRRQQLQPIKTHNPFLSLPLRKWNVGLSLALAWGTLITHNLASRKEALLLLTCTQ